MKDKTLKKQAKRELCKEEFKKGGLVGEPISSKELRNYVLKYFLIEWKMIALSQFLLFAQTYVNIKQPFFTQDFVEAAINNQQDILVELIQIYIFQHLFLILSEPILSIFINSYKRRLKLKIQTDIFQEILSKDVEYFEHTKFSSIQKLAHSGSKSVIELACGERIFTTLKTIFKALGHCYFLFYQSYKVALILLFFCLAKGILNHFSYRKKVPLNKQTYQEGIDKENAFQDVVQNILTVKTFGREEKEIVNYTNQLTQMQESEEKMEEFSRMIDLVSSILGKLQKIIILYYGSIFFIQSQEIVKVSTLTTLISYSMSFTQLYTAIKDLIGYDQQDMYLMVDAIISMIKIPKNQGITNQIFIDSTSDQKNTVQSNNNNSNDSLSTSIKGSLQFEDVSFKYSTSNGEFILKNLTFNVKSGEFVAFAGTSGSGKSTIVKLIERFYDCTQGSVLIDGINIKDLDLGALRANIGLVQQEPVLFDSTIQQNIIYGVDKYDYASLKEVCDISGVSEFVFDQDRFPLGLNTLVGSKGLLLSGGQKQRVAIARALLKKPKILIFDEATSSLDSESEFLVQQYIDELVKKRGMTIILVAHRLSTIVNCDRIFLMSKGEVIESGSHLELLEKNGFYKQLINRQLYSETNGEIKQKG